MGADIFKGADGDFHNAVLALLYCPQGNSVSCQMTVVGIARILTHRAKMLPSSAQGLSICLPQIFFQGGKDVPFCF